MGDSIRTESRGDTALSKDSSKAGIVKESQAGVIGDNVTVEGGIHYHGAGQAHIPLELPERPAHFTDRVKELDQLLSDLQPGRTVTLCGPGGIGKSALAAEAVWQILDSNGPPAKFPHGVIWHDFYTRPKAVTALEHIALAFGEEPVPTPFDAAQRALSGRTALLLLDGAEDTDNLTLITKIRGRCGVIVTSRKKEDAFAERQDIESLDPDEALKLLMAWGGDRIRNEKAARRICGLTGGLPLAVRLAGRYISVKGETPEEYLEFLEDTPLDALNMNKRKLESVPVLLKRSLKQIGKSAEDVLAVAGILAFDTFSRDVIAAALPNSHIWKPLDDLFSYGLLTRSEGRYQIAHALIHTYSRERLMIPDDSVIRRVAEYYEAFAGKQDHAAIDRERMHIMKVMEACKKQNEWKAVISLVWSADNYLNSRGHWTDQLAALETGLEAARKSEDRYNESSFLLHMGNCHYIQGRLNEAVADYANAIELRESLREILEPRSDWPPQMTNDLAAAYVNRGVALDSQGRYDKAVADYANAIELMESLRKIQESRSEWPPQMTNDLAGAYMNRGNVFNNQGRYDKAVADYANAIELMESLRKIQEPCSEWPPQMTNV
ncbi:MAG: tetratricopeptide repeat protein, partial [Desulfobacteraceae bacterium]|nr:tetratricopeptide repeat protein [Desulfobacteraceae bacterium]